MRSALVFMSLVFVAGCQRSTAPGAAGAPATMAPAGAPTARTRKSSMLQLHMRDHFADLRKIERHLVDGDLPTVRDYALALSYAPRDTALARWSVPLTRMRDAAMQLATAGDVLEAARLEPALATTCAACHVAAGARPVFPAIALVRDDGTALTRMARHQWAADRLWEAMITPSDDAWFQALDVLGATPLPQHELTKVATPSAHAKIGELSDQLQRRARDAMRATTPDERVAAYGGILQACVGCHDLAQ